ncbi:MAG: hypothetical protein ACD_7C00265G0006 [uncultured bacterium]|nr:MAG: hypothetical protein ACD_7C00265G0006 [uncultured bacterium]
MFFILRNSSVTNTTDALLTLRNSLGLSMNGTAWQSGATTGDVNCDLTSNSTDALLILRYSLGLSMDGTSWCES